MSHLDLHLTDLDDIELSFSPKAFVVATKKCADDRIKLTLNGKPQDKPEEN